MALAFALPLDFGAGAAGFCAGAALLAATALGTFAAAFGVAFAGGLLATAAAFAMVLALLVGIGLWRLLEGLFMSPCDFGKASWPTSDVVARRGSAQSATEGVSGAMALGTLAAVEATALLLAAVNLTLTGAAVLWTKPVSPGVKRFPCSGCCFQESADKGSWSNVQLVPHSLLQSLVKNLCAFLMFHGFFTTFSAVFKYSFITDFSQFGAMVMVSCPGMASNMLAARTPRAAEQSPCLLDRACTP